MNTNNNNNPQNGGMKIEVPADVASGLYSNLAIITHGPNEFFVDFITVAPNMPQAKVQSRIVLTPENAKNLMFAMMENVKKYEATFGEITPKKPLPTPGNPGETPNPFMTGGKA